MRATKKVVLLTTSALLLLAACSNPPETTTEAATTNPTSSEATQTSVTANTTTSTSMLTLAEQQPIRSSTVELVNQCFDRWNMLQSWELISLDDFDQAQQYCKQASNAVEADSRGIIGDTPLNNLAIAVLEVRYVLAKENLAITAGTRECFSDRTCIKPDDPTFLELERTDGLPNIFVTPNRFSPEVSDFAGLVYQN